MFLIIWRSFGELWIVPNQDFFFFVRAIWYKMREDRWFGRGQAFSSEFRIWLGCFVKRSYPETHEGPVTLFIQNTDADLSTSLTWKSCLRSRRVGAVRFWANLVCLPLRQGLPACGFHTTVQGQLAVQLCLEIRFLKWQIRSEKLLPLGGLPRGSCA